RTGYGPHMIEIRRNPDEHQGFLWRDSPGPSHGCQFFGDFFDWFLFRVPSSKSIRMEGVTTSSYCSFLTVHQKSPRKTRAISRLIEIRSTIMIIPIWV